MMKYNKLRTISLTLLLSTLSLFALTANASVGRVLFSIGNVTVEKPTVSRLRRNSEIDEGDVIVTGAKSYIQLKLSDGTKVAIRPNSRFVIEALEAPSTATRPAIGKGTRLRASFNLQRGGFRTITGRISKRDPSAYEVKTPSAVIRVRGTNYVARICAADCGATMDGLYVGVSNGAIALNNAGGELDLGKNQFGFAANFNTPPTRLTAPPAGLQDDGLALLEEEEGEESNDESSDEESGDEANDEESGDEETSDESADEAADESSDESSDESADEGSDANSGDDSSTESTEGSDESTDAMVADRGGDVSTEAASASSTTSGTDTTTNVDEVEQTITTNDGSDVTDGQSTPIGLAFSFGQQALGINANVADVVTDVNGNLSGFNNSSNNQSISFSIGTATNKNVGLDSSTGLRWGRWSDGIATQAIDGGAGTSIDLSNNSLHWLIAAESDTPVQVVRGSASYILVGNTDPTDNLGNVGVLGSASLSADFTNNSVQSTLALSVNNAVWNASGSGTINSNLFSGLYSTVSVNGVSGGSGSFGGIFAGFANGPQPTGAGLTYQLIKGSTTVNGTAVFNNTGR